MQIAVTVLDAQPRAIAEWSLESPVIGNGHAGFGRRASEKDPQGHLADVPPHHPGPGLRAGVHQDLHVRSVVRAGLGQRSRVGQTPSHPSRDRVHRPVERVRVLRSTGAVAGDLRHLRPGARAGVLRSLDHPDPNAADRRGSCRRLLVGALDAPGGDLPHARARRPAPRPQLLRSTRSGQHRDRAPRRSLGPRTGALRFGDERAALAGALCTMLGAVTGFTNKSLRPLVAGHLDQPHTQSKMSYDLRRLRLHGLIQRIPRNNT